MRRISKIRRSVKAISPVISVLLMIAIAVVASLVVYAWVTGYIGSTSNKVGKAILIQSMGPGADGMVVYVQNVGQGPVTFDPAGTVYVNDALLPLDQGAFEGKTTLNPGETAAIHTGQAWAVGDKVKIVTKDGTFTESNNKYYVTGQSVPLVLTIEGSGLVVQNPNQATYQIGVSVQLTATADVGWSFDHWSGDLSGSVNPATLTIDANPAVTAIFTQNNYALDPIIVGQGSVTPAPASYHLDDSVQLAAHPSGGWFFAGWSGDITTSDNPATLVIDETPEVTATFSQTPYTLTVTSNPTVGGTVGGYSGGPVHLNDVITLTANPATGYDFTKWEGDLTGTTNPKDLTITGNMVVTADFTLKTFAITINAGSNGQILLNGNPVSGAVTVNYGESPQFVISPNTGYHIANVLVDGNPQGPITSYTFNNVQATHTISATFAIDTFTITVSAGSGGTITPTGPVTVNYGANQGFTIAADAGNEIVDVLVDGASQGRITSYTFNNVQANHPISATFQVIPQVTYVSAGTGSGATGPNGNPTPTYPSTIQANDLILLQVAVRGSPATTTVTPPPGFNPTPLYGPESTGSGDAKVTQWVFYKIAVGGETGPVTVTISQTSGTNFGRVAMMYRFSNVALASFNENGGVGTGSTITINGQSVTTSGPKRLAVSFDAVGGDINLGTFSGGWTIAVTNGFHYSGGSEHDHVAIELNTAQLASQGTISGGSYTLAGAYPWIVRSFALIPR